MKTLYSITLILVFITTITAQEKIVEQKKDLLNFREMSTLEIEVFLNEMIKDKGYGDAITIKLKGDKTFYEVNDIYINFRIALTPDEYNAALKGLIDIYSHILASVTWTSSRALIFFKNIKTAWIDADDIKRLYLINDRSEKAKYFDSIIHGTWPPKEVKKFNHQPCL